ncbi:phosphoenolpyruvate carboxylase, partial [Escherichia coli]|nr:phosphoenolpyruvate carboxylase [Escherichia coli]
LLHQEVMMTYFDSAEDLTISKQRALQELAKHGVVASDIDVFFSELGEREEYNAQEVLIWLGY